jgi:DNA-binding MarR family transcriptional regulator
MTEQDLMNSKLRRGQWLEFVQAMHPDIDPRAVRLMDEMRLAAHALYQVGEHSLVDTGLSYAQYRILASLLFCEWTGDQTGLNPSEISAHQGTSRNTISALIRSLEDDGLIERRLDDEDRRRFNIRLTESGRRKVLDHANHHMQTANQIFAVLSVEEQEILSKLLHAINQRALAVKEQAPETNPPK